MALTPEELEDLKETFGYNDLNEDGKIEFGEFLNMLAALEADMSREEARVGFNAIDTDDDGSIDVDEFIAWWTEL